MTDTELSHAEDALNLEAMIRRATRADKKAPPVEMWNPPFCGDLDMEIKRDGTWFYLGTPIGRKKLVELFSSVLRKDEDGKTYLVTPVEKVGIRVEDAHFLAVEMTQTFHESGPLLTFRTNVGEVIAADKAHPLRFEIEEESGGLKPYLHIRGRLEALINRAVMYDLVALGETMDVNGQAMFCIRSGGEVFTIMPQADLDAAIT